MGQGVIAGILSLAVGYLSHKWRVFCNMSGDINLSGDMGIVVVFANVGFEQAFSQSVFEIAGKQEKQ